MTSDEAELSWWREEFARPGGAPEPDECPPPERLWEAVRGALPPGEVRDVVEHVARCAACSEEWRLAAALGTQVEEVRRAARPARRRIAAWGSVAAALAVLAAGGWRYHQLNPGATAPPAEFRGGEEEIRSADEGRTLPRSRFLLHWTPTAGAVSYDVEVFSDTSEPLTQREGVKRSQLLIPESDLRSLPASGTVYWSVTANFPGGRQLRSANFKTSVR